MTILFLSCSCRPYGAPFYGGLVAPFAFIYIMNWIIFILIFVSLLRKKSKKETTEQKGKAAKAKLKQNFIIALALSLLFGLGWGVGFAATTSISIAPVSVTIQAIFVLLTSFQGLFIFIMHCMRSEEARRTWKGWLYVITCHKVTPDRKISKCTSNSVTASGEAQYRHKATPNPYGTLTTSGSNTLKRILKKELDSSETYANESVFVRTTLETIQEHEKRDLSLSKVEKMKYELFPHHESPTQSEMAPGPTISNKRTHVSPLVIDTSPRDDMEMTILSPVSDTFEVVQPKAIHVLKAKKEEKATAHDSFDIIWVNMDETPADPMMSADLQTSSTPVWVNMDVIVETPADLQTSSAPVLVNMDAIAETPADSVTSADLQTSSAPVWVNMDAIAETPADPVMSADLQTSSAPVWVNMDAIAETPADPVTSADLQTSSAPVWVNMDAIAETPADPVTSADLQTSSAPVWVNMDAIAEMPADPVTSADLQASSAPLTENDVDEPSSRGTANESPIDPTMGVNMH